MKRSAPVRMSTNSTPVGLEMLPADRFEIDADRFESFQGSHPDRSQPQAHLLPGMQKSLTY